MSRRRRLGAVALAALLLGLAAAGQFLLRARRPDSAPALTEGALAALGGLRSIAAEVVWFRADRLQDEGRYVELAQLAHTLTFLEPHTPEVWSYAAWNLAYFYIIKVSIITGSFCIILTNFNGKHFNGFSL